MGVGGGSKRPSFSTLTTLLILLLLLPQGGSGALAGAPAAAATAEAGPPVSAPEPGIDPRRVTCRDLAALGAGNEAEGAEFAMDLIGTFLDNRGIPLTEATADRGFAAIEEGCAADPAGALWPLLQRAFPSR